MKKLKKILLEKLKKILKKKGFKIQFEIHSKKHMNSLKKIVHCQAGSVTYKLYISFMPLIQFLNF